MSVKHSSAIIGLLVAATAGCSNDGNPVGGESSLVYPLAVGNRWEYAREFAVFNSRPDTSDATPQHTVYATCSVEIVRTDTLLDSIACLVLREEFRDEEQTLVNEQYYSNEEDGLYLWAYKGTGHAIPKSVRGKRIYFKGRHFSSVAEISRFVQGAVVAKAALSDSMYYESPPVRRLAYPLSIGSQWVCRQAGSPWRVDKTVLGVENVTVVAGTFRCYKIQCLMDIDGDGKWDDDIDFYDYVSSEGLIKRHLFFGDTVLLDEWGEELGLLFDCEDSYELIGLDLK